MNTPIEHYEDKATQAVARANNANNGEGVAFWIGSGQIAATLALVYAVQEQTEQIRAGNLLAWYGESKMPKANETYVMTALGVEP